MVNNNDIHLMWDDAVLTIAPSNRKLEKFLTYKEKSLEPDPKKPWNKITRVKTVDLYTIIKEQPNYRVIQTMQGMWHKVKTFLENDGFNVKFYDMRLSFPAPKFELMHGFRFSQEALIKQFLSTNCSGLLGAPTRWGKSTLVKNTIRAFPDVNTVVTVPGTDLVKQLYDDIKESNPGREVVLLGGGSTKKYNGADVTVASMDSLHKCDTDMCRLLLIDEPHAAVTASRLPDLAKFDKARKLGFGATLKGRFDCRDILIEALIGPVLAERTYTEAVEEGAICPLVVYMIRIPILKSVDTRDRAYKNLLFNNDRIGKAVKWICHELLPKNWQTILFIKNESQAEFYMDWIGKVGTIAMAKRMSTPERRDTMERMASGDIKRCIASDIYSQGVTFNHVRALINLSGGGANTTTIQKPGRLAEIRPGKNCGIIFDFMFVPETGVHDLKGAQCLVRDSVSRLTAYLEKGYEVRHISGYEELVTAFNERIAQ